MTARGIRNNNPGNLREPKDGGDHWDGERATDDDKSFEEFDTPEHGIRALCKVLMNYYVKHDLKTVDGIIKRFAPPSENDTRAYVEVVCRRLGVLKDQEIRISRCGTLELLVRAIITHENGEQPYSDATILKGIRMSLQ